MPKFGLLAGEGKIGLFKSLRGLRGSELRYAVGYNMSTLRMLGVPLAGLVSLPYDIQQGLNTIKRASQIVTQQSLKPGIQRAGVLGYARNIVPKARSLVPRTNVGIIDRYSSVYFGQASRRAIQMINSGQGRKAAFKAMFNPEVIDREIKRQGLAPRHDNVLYKWQLGTYMRAITGAPDPVLNNPYMQAKQYLDEHKTTDGFKLDARFGIADSKGQHLMMSNARFAQTLGEAGGMTPFAAESHVQNAMNAYMDDYMMSALDKDTAYIRKYNNLVQKNADLDRRKALVQTYRAMGMDKGLEGGNTYNLSMQLGDRGLNMERDDSGELIGYSTKFSSGEVSGAGKDLVSYRKNKVSKSINKGYNIDVQTANPQLLAKDFSIKTTVDPSFANHVQLLANDLGLNAATLHNQPIEQMMTTLAVTLTTVGQTESLSTTNPAQSAKNMGDFAMAAQMKAILRFVRNIDREGYSQTAENILAMIGSKKFMKSIGDMSISEGAQLFEDRINRSATFAGTSKSYDNIPRNESGLATDEMQGMLYRKRKDAHHRVASYLAAGGGIVRGNTAMTDYFYNPNIQVSPGQSIYDPLQNAVTRYLNDEGTRSRTQYYKSYGSLRYAENITQFRARTMGHNKKFKDLYFGKEDSGADIVLSAESQQQQYRNMMKQTHKFQKQLDKYGSGDYFLEGMFSKGTDAEMELRTLLDLDDQDMSYLFQQAMLPGYKVPAAQGGSFARKSFSPGPSVSYHPGEPGQGYSGNMRKSSVARGLNKKRRKQRLRKFMLNARNQDEVTRDRKKHRARADSDNFIPNKKDIAGSVHMVKSHQSKVALLQFSVVAGTRAGKLNMHPTKALRDIAQIEYGGPATDSSFGISRRTDGMFYLPSFFFTRAAMETASLLGMERGSSFTSVEKSVGRELSFKFGSKDNPDGARLSMKERRARKETKDATMSLKRMAMSQIAFAKLHRRNQRLLEDRGIRLANKRALSQSKAAEAAMFGEDQAVQGRYYDPETLLQDSTDRFLNESLAGHGKREFKMNALGRAIARNGTVGLGPNGFVMHSTGKMREVTPRTTAEVWSFDNPDNFIPSRTPYIPVFDPLIYKQLAAMNAQKAKNYLMNSQRAINSSKKISFQGEYTRSSRDITQLGDVLLQKGMGNSYQTIKAVLGGTSGDIRNMFKAMLGTNGFPNYQEMIDNQEYDWRFKQIRDTFAGQRTQVNLDTHFKLQIEERMADILMALEPAQAQMVRDEIRRYASGLATKTTRSLRTIWSNKTVAGTITRAEDLFHAVERTVIILEQAMAYGGDQAGMFAQLFRSANGQRGRLDFLKQFGNPNEIRFQKLGPFQRSADAVVQSELTIEFTDGEMDLKRLKKAEGLGIEDEANIVSALDGDVVQYDRTTKMGDDGTLRTTQYINPGESEAVIIAKYRNALSDETNFEIEDVYKQQADILANTFRYNTHVEAGKGTSVHAEMIRAYNERHNRRHIPHEVDWKGSVINAQGRDGSGVFDDRTSSARYQKIRRETANGRAQVANVRTNYTPVTSEAKDWFFQTRNLLGRWNAGKMNVKTYAESFLVYTNKAFKKNSIQFLAPNKNVNTKFKRDAGGRFVRSGEKAQVIKTVSDKDIGLVFGEVLHSLNSDAQRQEFITELVYAYGRKQRNYYLGRGDALAFEQQTKMIELMFNMAGETIEVETEYGTAYWNQVYFSESGQPLHNFTQKMQRIAKYWYDFYQTNHT